MSFGKVSSPVVAESSTPYASGIAPDGRMTAAVKRHRSSTARRSSPGSPRPARRPTRCSGRSTRYPWKTGRHADRDAGDVGRPADHDAGHWYYRVRGVNPSLPSGAQTMSWSDAGRALKISGNVFRSSK